MTRQPIPREAKELFKAHKEGRLTKDELTQEMSAITRSMTGGRSQGQRTPARVEIRGGRVNERAGGTNGRFTLKDAMAMSPSATGPNGFICKSDLQIWLDEGLIDGVE